MLTCFETFRQVLNCKVLILKRRAILMIQPSELLQHLGMTTVVGDYTLVGVLRTDVLHAAVSKDV